jgi:N6-L-threonylcarbamoyladenine synthase
VLSSRIASQVDLHAKYGGVVPEVASRAHAEAISPLFREALREAHVGVRDINLISVSNRPGLIGALLVGVSFAKSLAYAARIPLVGVSHIMSHIDAAYIADAELQPPFVALVVSGGHTSIVHVRDYSDALTIARTRDDAAGEAFDKVGRLLGFPYPGGAAMDRAAAQGDSAAIKFPSPIAGELDFSFSGLKTNAVNLIHNYQQKGLELPINDLAASYTKAAVEALISRLALAVNKCGVRSAVIAGGVAANSHLRSAAAAYSASSGVRVVIPPVSLCGDNAAMVGAAGYFEYTKNGAADLDLNAYATGRAEGERL